MGEILLRRSVLPAVLAAGVLLVLSGARVCSAAAADEAAAVRSATAAGGQERIRASRKVVVLFSGVDPLRTKVMEDALALELMSAGTQVVPRARVETIISEKVDAATRAMSEALQAQDAAAKVQAAQPAGSTPRPAPSLPAIEPVGAVQVATTAGAQIVLVGTMLEERRREGAAGGPLNAQVLQMPAVVVTASLQVIDAETGSLLMVVTGQWPNGTGIPQAAAELAAALRR